MRLGVGFLSACLLTLGEGLAQPAANPEDLAEGERLFASQCAYCHGPRGEGGRGAMLARPRLLRASDDQALIRVISRGIPGTEMPSAALTSRQVEQVAGYVRTLGRIAKPAVTGDPGRGEKLYAAKGGCVQCHTVAGRGGAIGPDLTEIGSRRGVAHLREALLDPGATVPDDFLQVRVVTKDGRRITGVRLNEDTTSIQLRDLTGDFHSFWKSEISELHKDRGKSPMPNYKTVFTPAEIDDLLAYLSSLQGSL